MLFGYLFFNVYWHQHHNMKKIIFSLLLPVWFLAQAFSALAVFNPLDSGITEEINKQTQPVSQPTFNPSTNANSIFFMVSQILTVFFGLLATIFLILIVLAGYKWMMAQGNKSKIEEAQSSIRTAIIGLVIIIASYAITYWIFARLPDGQSVL